MTSCPHRIDRYAQHADPCRSTPQRSPRRAFDTMITAGTISVVSEEVGWEPLSKSKPGTVAQAGPAKNKKAVEFNEDSEIAFFCNIWRFSHTALSEIWPQLIAQCLIVIAVWMCLKFWPDYTTPKEITTAHSMLGKPLAFLLVYKSGQGYGNYVEGRKQLGGLCNNCREMAQYTFTYKLSDQADMVKVEMLRKVIRRKLNLMMGFMRQWARESREGFEPGCELESEPFVGDGEDANWHRDPCSPAIANMISEEEFHMYNAIKPTARPAYVQAELNMLAAELSTETAYPDHMLNGFTNNSADTVNLFKGCFRIVETAVPHPYLHLLYMLNLLYTWSVPLIYCPNATPELNEKFEFLSGWTASLLICACFNGIMEVSGLLHNPFGHDLIDHDMGEFCRKAHNETKVIAGMVKAEVGSDMTDYTKAPTNEQA